MVSTTVKLVDINPQVPDTEFLDWLAVLTRDPATTFHRDTLIRLMQLAGSESIAGELERGGRKHYDFEVGALIPYIQAARARLPKPSPPPEP